MKSLIRTVYGTAVRAVKGSGLDNIAPIHALHNAILRRLRPNSVTVFDMVLHLDAHDSLNLSIHGEHEPVLTRFIRAVVPRGANAIDVGAHIGYFTLLLADTVGPDGNVTSFEAHPANAALLQQSVTDNALRQVVPMHCAVTDQDGMVEISVSNSDSVDHRIFLIGEREGVLVPCRSLDSVIEAGTPIDFIKMDIQGAEGLALEGMRRLVSEQQNLILVSEYEPWGLKESGYGARQYCETLVSMGFQLHDLNEKSGELTATSPDALEKQYPAVKDRFTTLIAEISAPNQSRLERYTAKRSA